MLKALDISLIIYHLLYITEKYYLHLFKKTGLETLIILYKTVIYQEMISLIWSVQRSHMYVRLWHALQIMKSSCYIWCYDIYFDTKMFLSG